MASNTAWQAGLKVAWDKEASGDLIAAVSRRLFDYANHVTGYNMRVDGQEDLMSIQYFGNGTDDPRPDRYSQHCDGDCDGMSHKTGGRVATMVMYCDVPELGGGTNFQNSNVFVKPTAGAAAFFSYMDPRTQRHEEGFTSHSGCPVFKGTKRIAVQWMRVGVDLENPWDSFDTNTVKKQPAVDVDSGAAEEEEDDDEQLVDEEEIDDEEDEDEFEDESDFDEL
jgi:2OG-Fe(II) oxygenase superfamily